MRYELEAREQRARNRESPPPWWSTRAAGDGEEDERRSTPGGLVRVMPTAIVTQPSARPPGGQASMRGLIAEGALQLTRHTSTRYGGSRVSAASGVLSDSATILKLLRKMVWQLAWEVAQQMLGSVVPRYRQLINLKAELDEVYRSNDSYRRKIRHLAEIISTHAKEVPSWLGEGRVREYLLAVAYWMQIADEQWGELTSTVTQVRDEPALLGKIVALADTLDTLLESPAVEKMLDPATVGTIRSGLTPIKTMLTQLHLIRSKPGGAQWQDYLSLIAEQERLPAGLREVLSLAHQIARIQGVRPYQAGATVAEQLTWLIDVLSDPRVLKKAEPLLGKETVNFLEQVLGVGQQALQFPAEGGLTAQGLWLFALLSKIPGIGSTSVAIFMNGLREVLGGDEESRAVFELLMQLSQPNVSRRDLAWRIGKKVSWQVGRQLGPQLAWQTVRGQLPDWTHHLAVAAYQFYQGIKMDEKWTEVVDRLMNSMVDALPPLMISYLSPNSASATTVRMARAIGKHKSWEETVRYLVTEVKGKDKTLALIYGQYLNACLAWQIYQAFRSGEEREDKLRALARVLKDTQVVTAYPHLEKLIDLVPLIPALQDARKNLQVKVATADSWLTWGNTVVGELAGSESPTLVELRRQLSEQMVHWLAQGLKTGLFALGNAGWEAMTRSGAQDVVAVEQTPRAAALPVAPPAAAIVATETHYTGRKLLSIEASEGEREEGAAPVSAGATAALPMEGEEETEDDAWDIHALVDLSAGAEQADESGNWRGWGKIGAGASAGIGMLAALAMVWRMFAARGREPASTEPGDAEGGLLEAPAGEPGAASKVGGAEAQQMLPVNQDPPYNETVEPIPGAEPSTLARYGLPLAAATFGVAIPSAIWLTMSLTEETPIEELSVDEIDTIVKSVWARQGAAGARAKRDVLAEGALTSAGAVTTTEASTTDAPLPTTPTELLDHYLNGLPVTNRASVRHWLRRMVRLILDTYQRAEREASVLHITIDLDIALGQWLQTYGKRPGQLAYVGVMQALSERIRTDLVLESSESVVRNFLTQIGVMPSEHKARLNRLLSYMARRDAQGPLPFRVEDEYAEDAIEELEYLQANPGGHDPLTEVVRRMIYARITQIGGEEGSYYFEGVYYIRPNQMSKINRAELSRKPPKITLQEDASMTREPTLVDWFNPLTKTPQEFIDQWISSEMKKAGLDAKTTSRNIGVNYIKNSNESHNALGDWLSPTQRSVEKGYDIWKLEEIATRSYAKKLKEMGGIAPTFLWPDNYPTAFRDAIEQGKLWDDFEFVLKDFLKSKRADVIRGRIAVLAKGIAYSCGVYKGGYTSEEFEGRARKVIFKFGWEVDISGIFELDGKIYSIYDGSMVDAKADLQTNESLRRMIVMGMSKKDLDAYDQKPFERKTQLTGRGGTRAVFPKLQFENISDGFGETMLGTLADKFYATMDKAIRSNAELEWAFVAAMLQVTLTVISILSSPILGPVGGIALAVAMMVPDAIRITNADEVSEKREAATSMVLGFFLDAGIEVLGPVMFKAIGKFVTKRVAKLIPEEIVGKQAPVVQMEDLEDWADEMIPVIRRNANLPASELEKLLAAIKPAAAGRVPKEVRALQAKAYKLEGMDAYLATPKAKCREAAKGVFDLARADHFETEVVQLLIWVSPLDTIPRSHFVVRVRHQGVAYIVDPTITQFTQVSGMSPLKIYAGPEADWLNKFQDGFKGLTIKCQVGNAWLLNSHIVTQPILTPGELIAEATWYRASSRPSTLALESKSELASRHWVRNSSSLKEAIAGKGVKSRLARILKNKGNAATTNSMGLSRAISQRLSVSRTAPAKLKELLSTESLATLSTKSLDEQILGLRALDDQVDRALKQAPMAQDNPSEYLDDLIALKYDLDIRRGELAIKQAETVSVSSQGPVKSPGLSKNRAHSELEYPGKGYSYRGPGNTLENKPKVEKWENQTKKEFFEQVGIFDEELKLWRSSGEQYEIVETIPYGSTGQKLHILFKPAAAAGDDAVMVGYIDVDDYRLMVGYSPSIQPAASPVHTLLVSMHGSFEGDRLRTGVIPNEFRVSYPVPYGMIYKSPRLKEIMKDLSEFGAHTIVNPTQQGGYVFGEMHSKGVAHTMRDRAFDALGLEAAKQTEAGLETRLQIFRRFEDDTTLHVANAIKTNRLAERHPADILTMAPHTGDSLSDQTELFRAIQKINAMRDTPYTDVYIAGCRQVTFQDDPDGAKLKRFLAMHLEMEEDHIQLVMQKDLLDELQAYHPQDPDSKFKKLPTGRRDPNQDLDPDQAQASGSRSKREGNSSSVLSLVTLRGYEPVSERMTRWEVVVGCVTHEGIVWLDSAKTFITMRPATS